MPDAAAIGRNLPADYREAILSMTDEQATQAILRLPSGQWITNEPLAELRQWLKDNRS